MNASTFSRIAGAALAAALCATLVAGCAGTAVDIRSPLFSVEAERVEPTDDVDSDAHRSDSTPPAPPANSDTSTSVATAQDNAVTYNISNVQGDVIIGSDPRPTGEAEAPELGGAGSEDVDIADPLRAQICRFEGFTPEAYHDGAAWHIACGHKLDEVEMTALRDEDLKRFETEARRLLGARLDVMAPARRDALYWLCFTAACAGIENVLAALRSDPPNWDSAAAEVTDSEFRNDPRFSGRAPITDCIAS